MYAKKKKKKAFFSSLNYFPEQGKSHPAPPHSPRLSLWEGSGVLSPGECRGWHSRPRAVPTLASLAKPCSYMAQKPGEGTGWQLFWQSQSQSLCFPSLPGDRSDASSLSPRGLDFFFLKKTLKSFVATVNIAVLQPQQPPSPSPFGG